MGVESLEDTSEYDWLDTDQNYPLDPPHTYGWREQNGQGPTPSDVDEDGIVWLYPWCEEHNVCVRTQRTAMATSSSEERREWIADHRKKLDLKCVEQMGRRMPRWATPAVSVVQQAQQAIVSQQTAEAIKKSLGL